jgi:anti-sigma factor RsiW
MNTRSGHPSPAVLECYRDRTLSPAELLDAGDHVTACEQCREVLLPADQWHTTAAELVARLSAPGGEEPAHLSGTQLEACLDGILDPVQRELVESHVARCPACAADLEDLRAFRVELDSHPVVEHAPGPCPGSGERQRAGPALPAVGLSLEVRRRELTERIRSGVMTIESKSQKARGVASLQWIALGIAAVAVVAVVRGASRPGAGPGIRDTGTSSTPTFDAEAAASQQAAEEAARQEAARQEAARQEAERRQRLHTAELLENRVAKLQQTLDEMTARSNELDTRVHQYMMEHKEAVIALAAGVGGSGVALDSSNQYSDEARMVGGIAAGLALVWAVQHPDEIREVAESLATASTTRADYTRQMEDLRRTIAEEQAKIDHLRSE